MVWKVLKLSSEGIFKTFLMFFKQMHLTRFISSYCAIINESNVHGEQEGEKIIASTPLGRAPRHF